MKREVVGTLVGRGHQVSRCLSAVGLSPGSYYQRRTGAPRGRPLTTRTAREDGVRVPDTEVVELIGKALEIPFVDFGYLKMSYWLRDNHGLVANHKKIWRLMREHGLLNRKEKPPKRVFQQARGCSPSPDGPGKHFEIDIITLWMPAIGRHVYLVSCIDLFHRYWTKVHASFHARAGEIVEVIRGLIGAGCVDFTIRTDNGGQFISKDLEEALSKMPVTHEFIRPRTPQQNAHVESFHSILRRAVEQNLEGDEKFDDLMSLLNNYRDYYNNVRIHSGTAYYPPTKFLQQWQAGNIREGINKKGNRKFLRAKGDASPLVSEAKSNGVKQDY